MNNQAKHTPGPWTSGNTVTDYNAVGTETGSGITIRYDGPDHHWHIATVYGQREEKEPLACKHGYQSANARLIAAAPQLLEALRFAEQAMFEALTPEDEQLNQAIKQARAAIAKAQGGVK